MALKGVNHIGIAVTDLDQATRNYVDKLGARRENGPRELPSMKAQMLSVGNNKIELLEAAGTEGPIAKFLKGRGEGIHHICLAVDDVDNTIETLLVKGVNMIDKVARQGLEGRAAFIHPKETNGVLIEIVQIDEQGD